LDCILRNSLKNNFMQIAILDATEARKKLHHFIDEMGDTRAINLYGVLKDDVEEEEDSIYTDEFVAELDRRWEAYKNGAKTYSEEEFRERINKLRMQPNF
jgi:putative addiction module component (TIGR02574 family)